MILCKESVQIDLFSLITKQRMLFFFSSLSVPLFFSFLFRFPYLILAPPFSYLNSYLHSRRSFALSQSRYHLFVQYSDTYVSYERSYIFYCNYLRTLCLVQFGSVAMEFSLSSQKSILDMRRRLAENAWQRHI